MLMFSDFLVSSKLLSTDFPFFSKTIDIIWYVLQAVSFRSLGFYFFDSNYFLLLFKFVL